jgi:NAD(P)H-dependent FMN reductase
VPHLLAISGSLRARSTNTELLRAAALVAPAGTTVDFYDGLASLPHFNPDVEETALPREAAELRAAVGRADALIISTPEYAHGLPGSLKNALDWLVGGPEMVGKRVALWHSTTWSTHAPAQLAEILRTMSAVVVEEASVVVNLRGGSRTAAEIAGDLEASAMLQRSLVVLSGKSPRA